MEGHPPARAADSNKGVFHTHPQVQLKPQGQASPKSERDIEPPISTLPATPGSVSLNAGSSDDDDDDDEGHLPEVEYFSPTGVKLEVVELPVVYDTKEWLKHVEKHSEGGKAPWRCTWETMKNGKPEPCSYSSKKHLVKRHIEATHLRIK